MEEKYRLQHIMSALEFRMDSQNVRFELLEQKTQMVISVSSVVVAVIGLFGLTDATIQLLERLAVIATMAAFAFTLFHALNVFRLREWKDPFGERIMNEEIYQAEFKPWVQNVPDKHYHEEAMDQYAEIIRFNERVLLTKSASLQKALSWLRIELIITGLFVTAKLIVPFFT